MTTTQTATPSNIARAMAALVALPLLASAAVFGVTVTRASLLGFRVGTDVLELDAAAERLATLVWRTRGALAKAVLRLRHLRVAGTYSVKPGHTVDGRPLVVVTVRVASEVDYAAHDERSALIEAMLACREAYLYASMVGNAVHVVG